MFSGFREAYGSRGIWRVGADLFGEVFNIVEAAVYAIKIFMA